MEQTGRVIIFDNEDDARLWFDIINETIKQGKIESRRMDFERFKERMKREENEVGRVNFD